MVVSPLYELEPQQIASIPRVTLRGLAEATGRLLTAEGYPALLQLQIGPETTHGVPADFHNFTALEVISGIYRVNVALEELPKQSPRTFNLGEYYYTRSDGLDPDDITLLGRVFADMPPSWHPKQELMRPREISKGMEYGVRGLISGASLLPDDVWYTERWVNG